MPGRPARLADRCVVGCWEKGPVAQPIRFLRSPANVTPSTILPRDRRATLPTAAPPDASIGIGDARSARRVPLWRWQRSLNQQLSVLSRVARQKAR